MRKPVTPAIIGALVRDTRVAAGISQSELGQRVGASRFWVAQFEKGKPGAELGLALKALDALGLSVRVEPREVADTHERAAKGGTRALRTSPLPPVDLGQIIATTTVGAKATSTAGWPATKRTSRRP